MQGSSTGQGRPFFHSNITGAIGELLAVVDLMKKGYYANLAGCQFPYDVLVEIDNRIYRVQVKSTASPTLKRKHSYDFKVSNKVRGNDLVAFVAVDLGVVAYLPAFKCNHARMQFKAPGSHQHSRRKGFNLDHFTLGKALKELHEKETTAHAHQAKLLTER